MGELFDAKMRFIVLSLILMVGVIPMEAFAADPEEVAEGQDPAAVEVTVPIYNYDVVNVVAPAKFAVALNPYELPVKTGEDAVSTEQVVSRKYGIINKSSTDKVVTVTLTVEDLNDGKIVFTDSAEEAENAGEDVYAVYLAAVPADSGEIRIGGENADQDTTSAELSDVGMTGAQEQAVALHEGGNKIAFRLSKAVYDFGDGGALTLDAGDADHVGNQLKLTGLAPGGESVTAFTFTGVMNPKADWAKLLNGIRMSAVYTYETADGDEIILEGTGAMIEAE